ncbi:SLC13 family permease [Actinoplanes sp. URMC 104]|uniref:GntT/GntP/DsdX family permease n=1 Tax=Actinoplanes sp. URMC 104 TaxID=3423409 RepID=UPI003F1E32F7
MPLVIVGLAVIVLLVLTTRLKLNAFPALILVALGAGLAQGMPLSDTYESIVDGIGGQVDDLLMILGFGAMLGRILADSGAAQRIATSMVRTFKISRVQLAMVLTAFAIGITMFYEVGFILLIPIVYTIVRENRLPLLWVGLPMSIALSTMHSFLPPHPGPAAVAGTFEASMGLTLLYGLPIALPAAALIAFSWPRLPGVKRMHPAIPAGLVAEQDLDEADLPSFGTCLAIVLIPVVLMAGAAVGELAMAESNPVLPFLVFFGEGPIALLIALLVAIVVLGPRIGRAEQAPRPEGLVLVDERTSELQASEATAGVSSGATSRAGTAVPTAASTSAPERSSSPSGPPTPRQPSDDPPDSASGGTASPGGTASTGDTASPGGAEPRSRARRRGDRYDGVLAACTDAVKPMAIILLIIGAGGAFKQVLVDSGMADYVKDLTAGWSISPLVLAWLIAAILRLALGSATVAVVTAAGVVAPLVATSGASPELMVIAVSCGSIAFSHVNDPGFWLFKEFFGLSVVQALKARTTYTTALGVLGLGGVLLMSTFVG